MDRDAWCGSAAMRAATTWVVDRLGSGLYTVQVMDRSTGEVSVVRVLVR